LEKKNQNIQKQIELLQKEKQIHLKQLNQFAQAESDMKKHISMKESELRNRESELSKNQKLLQEKEIQLTQKVEEFSKREKQIQPRSEIKASHISADISPRSREIESPPEAEIIIRMKDKEKILKEKKNGIKIQRNGTQ